MVLARGLGQPRGLQQASQLAGENGRLGRQIFIEKVLVRIVQKCHRANHFIRNNQRGGHQRPGSELLRRRKRGGADLIQKNGAPAARRFRRHGAVVGMQLQSHKGRGQLAVAVFPNKFAARLASPKIDARDLEKFPGNAAEQFD